MSKMNGEDTQPPLHSETNLEKSVILKATLQRVNAPYHHLQPQPLRRCSGRARARAGTAESLATTLHSAQSFCEHVS